MACPDQFEDIVVDMNEELPNNSAAQHWLLPSQNVLKIVLHVVLSHKLDFSSYIYPFAIKNKHRYEKYRLDLPDITDPIYPFLQIFVSAIGRTD